MHWSVIFIVLFGFSFAVEGALIAYFAFDNSTAQGVTSSCDPASAVRQTQLSAPTLIPNVYFQSSQGKWGGCIQPSNGLVDVGTWGVGTTTGLTVSSWVYLWSNNGNGIFISKGNGDVKQGRTDWQLSFVGDPKNQAVTFVFTARISGNNIPVASASIPYNSARWVNVVGTFDGEQQIIYVDTQNTTILSSGTLTESISDPVTIGGQYDSSGKKADGSSAFQGGFLDEIKIFDYALSPTEVASIQTTAPPSNPGSLQVLIEDPPSTTITTADALTLYSNTSSTGVQYYWYLISATTTTSECTSVSFVTANSSSTPVLFSGGNTGGIFNIGLCISNQYAVTSADISVTVTPSLPKVVSLDPFPQLEVIEGSDATVTIVALAAVGYQWQELKESAFTNNSKRGFTDNYNNPIEYNTMSLEQRKRFSYEYVAYHNWRISDMRQLLPSSEQFENIEGGNSSVLHLRNVSTDDDGKIIRCVVTNILGDVPSGNITLKVIPASAIGDEDGAGGDGSTSTNVGGIVGGIIGGLFLLCCCTFLLILLLLFVYVKNKNAKIKLDKPDYDEVVYGKLANDDMFTSKPDESQQEGLSLLEKLLVKQDPNAKTYRSASERGEFVFSALLYENIMSKSRDLEYPASRSGLVLIFLYNDCAEEFLRQLITKEIQNSKKSDTLFRSNSPAAQFFTMWVKAIGLNYIWETLVIGIHELNDSALRKARGESGSKYVLKGGLNEDGSDSVTSSSSTGLSSTNLLSPNHKDGRKDSRPRTLLDIDSMEIDPLKLVNSNETAEASDVNINTLQLWLIAQKILNAIFKSEKRLPAPLRRILSHVYQQVEEQFDQDTAIVSIGAFFFLRFICTALMAPYQWGLLKEVPENTCQRQLILLSKVLQNLANRTLPGQKEKYMKRLDDFITTNEVSLVSWYEKVRVPGGHEVSPERDESVRLNSLSFIYLVVEKNQGVISASLKNKDDGDEIVEQLNEIFTKVGELEPVSES